MSDSTPLVGDALKARVEELKPMVETDMAIACGYISSTGKPRLTAFKDALLAAHGLAIPKAPRKGATARGRSLSFTIRAGTNTGNIVLSGGYAALIGIEPGQQVAITHQGNSLVLTPAGVTAVATPMVCPAPAVVTYDSTPEPALVAA